jgi:hypothetical protein
MSTDSSEPYEPTEDEIAQIRGAKTADVEEIDQLIVANCASRWKKVAMLVGQLLDVFDSKYAHLPYCMIQVRIDALEDRGVLEVAGDPWAIRSSEVRLAHPSSEA